MIKSQSIRALLFINETDELEKGVTFRVNARLLKYVHYFSRRPCFCLKNVTESHMH